MSSAIKITNLRPPAKVPLHAQPGLFRVLLALSVPVLIQNLLNMFVGLTDTYLANHLPTDAAAATAAVGTITYFLWFIGLIAGAIGSGSTALIARAIGAKHRSLANSVTGQSVLLSLVIGTLIGVAMFVFASPLAEMSALQGEAHRFALIYIRLLAFSLPCSTLMYVAGSCLRGGGDTVTPAIAMIVVDVVNVLMTFGLCRGLWGLPNWGFIGIAVGTIIAYVAGGFVLFAALLRGETVRLHLHRMKLHWHTMRRVLKIGIPSGTEGFLSWLANFGVVIVINKADPTNAMAAAHINAIRIESISFMTGLAVATAAATLVGQSLGAKNPQRATRSAYLGYALGGGAMAGMGVLFILFGRLFAQLLSNDPHIVDLTTKCLFITGMIQSGFAAALVFGGALRGAGDTLAVMLLTLSTVFGIRFAGVMIVGLWLHMGLAAIWCVLAGELFLRGVVVFLRFWHGGWKRVEG